jgi:adenylate cyclase class 2
MSTQNAIETEVKIPVPTWSVADATQHIAALGLNISAPRIFEANYVYDTPGQSIRGAGMLLRLRRVGDRNMLTWKGVSEPGPYKSRPELELKFESFDTMHLILCHLGYQTYFRYEKFRTEFSNGQGTVTFDETPIGNYLELEGNGSWIDETASRLAFFPDNYLLASYYRLYLADCENKGVQPSNMLFPAKS